MSTDRHNTRDRNPAVPDRMVDADATRALIVETWHTMANALRQIAERSGGTFTLHEGPGDVESIADLAGGLAGVLYTLAELPSSRFYLTAVGALGTLSGAAFAFLDGHLYVAARLASLARDTFDRWIETSEAARTAAEAR